ncbi:recombinase family protein [Virgibacillus alimentarius]|uniref:Site-specific DNA recombinase n=1 Tax=Virgibacillus alimentarius TaxID=698769 RepID=A0ABS4S8T2_9BACI|nr:recombinase family protein [Virgibacillus alimentarius]MBP2257476.1 site-specific DNA recombinase [Virgibacillus alimentarius]
MTNPTKAALYARVSTEEQATVGYSIQAQISEIEAYARKNELEIVERYVDEGFSGKNISGRPQMKQLIKDIDTNKFSTIIVYKIDRISRKTKDALEISDQCEQGNISLISVTEPFDFATSLGKFVYQMVSNVSELERNMIVARGKMGMIQRAKEGYYNGGRVLGYDSVNKELVINEEEAHVVRLIFDYAEQDLGYKAIVSRINTMGYKTKRGYDFSINTIKTILDNPIYIGQIRYNKYQDWAEKHRKGINKDYIISKGKHEPIISQEQWDRVQQFRKKRSVKPARSNKPYILNGLVRCPKCGYGMVSASSKGSKGKKYRYYVCGLFHNKGSKACSAHSIRADLAEQQVMEELKRIVSEPYVLNQIIDNVNEQRSDAKTPINDEIKVLQSKLNKVEVRINNITEQLMDDPSLVAIFKPKLKGLTEEQGDFQNRLEALNSELGECDTTPIDAQALHHLLSNFEKVMQDADPERQKALFRLIIKNIQISKEAPRGIGRHIEKINLHFDFTMEGLEEQSLELLDAVGMDYIEPVESWMLEKKDGKMLSEMMDSLNILPLKDVRFPPHNPKSPVHLL